MNPGLDTIRRMLYAPYVMIVKPKQLGRGPVARFGEGVQKHVVGVNLSCRLKASQNGFQTLGLSGRFGILAVDIDMSKVADLDKTGTTDFRA